MLGSCNILSHQGDNATLLTISLTTATQIIRTFDQNTDGLIHAKPINQCQTNMLKEQLTGGISAVVLILAAQLGLVGICRVPHNARVLAFCSPRQPLHQLRMHRAQSLGNLCLLPPLQRICCQWGFSTSHTDHGASQLCHNCMIQACRRPNPIGKRGN